jgi:hypothetical protein
MHVLSRTLRRSADLRAGLDPLSQDRVRRAPVRRHTPDATVSDIARGLRLHARNVRNTVRLLAGPAATKAPG